MTEAECQFVNEIAAIQSRDNRDEMQQTIDDLLCTIMSTKGAVAVYHQVVRERRWAEKRFHELSPERQRLT